MRSAARCRAAQNVRRLFGRTKASTRREMSPADFSFFHLPGDRVYASFFGNWARRDSIRKKSHCAQRARVQRPRRCAAIRNKHFRNFAQCDSPRKMDPFNRVYFTIRPSPLRSPREMNLTNCKSTAVLRATPPSILQSLFSL